MQVLHDVETAQCQGWKRALKAARWCEAIWLPSSSTMINATHFGHNRSLGNFSVCLGTYPHACSRVIKLRRSGGRYQRRKIVAASSKVGPP